MYKFILPIRYFLTRRITILAVAAITLCVFIVVVVMSVMSGLVSEFKDKNHDYVGDAVLSSDSLVGFPYYEDFVSQLEEADFVEAVSPVIRGFGLLRQPWTENIFGVDITGLDPVKHSRATGFGDSLHYNKDNPAKAFVRDGRPDAPGCVVGTTKMYQSDSKGNFHRPPQPPYFNFEISSFPLNAKGGLARKGTSVVSTKSFLLADDSHSGIVKVDSNMIYIPFDEAQKLFEMAGPNQRINTIHIKFKPGNSIVRSTARVEKMWQEYKHNIAGQPNAGLLDHVRIETWQRNRREIIAPMEKEQTMLTMLFLMLGFITVFVIFVVFYMIIAHKSMDIGILKSMGVPAGAIMSIFLSFAAIIGITGSVIGAAAGCGFLLKINAMEDWLFENYSWQLWDRTVYAIGEIPHEIKPAVIATIILSAVAAAVLGALIPAAQAGSKKPVEVLQVNQA